ncbi:MAG: hypothetical protein KatS3mg057_2883 [Herpetosiphonaceae bacterium]|nr:MAG: hypothetical protein KatS3mg057_2883 [Herpetosiphonaceae bacterium]
MPPKSIRFWRPPLTSTQLLSDVVAVGQRREGLRLLDIPLGLLDDPQNASQEPLILSLAERGSILVVGSSSSGKTSLLRSCVLALSATHSPAEVAFYIIDSTGQGLGFRADQGTNKEPAAPALPHIGDVLRTTDYTKIDRLLSVLEDEIRDRQQHFLQIGVELLGRLPAEPAGEQHAGPGRHDRWTGRVRGTEPRSDQADQPFDPRRQGFWYSLHPDRRPALVGYPLRSQEQHCDKARAALE